jgi:hypothetical protein
LYQSATTTTPGLNFFESKDINSWSPTSQPNLTTVNTNLSITGSYDLKYQTVSSYDTSSNLTTFYSTDYGKTWSQSITQLYYSLWLSSDYTGSSQLSCGFYNSNNGYVYYSNDYGKTWNTISNIPKLPYSNNNTNNPVGTCISGDNSVWLIGDYNGYIQYSTNKGLNWNLSNITITNDSFGLIKSSYSGNVIITISYLFQNVYLGRFYISYDKGANFVVPSDLSSIISSWLSCDISASGKIITALSKSLNNLYYYYISTDYGFTWKITDVTNSLDNGINNIAIN